MKTKKKRKYPSRRSSHIDVRSLQQSFVRSFGMGFADSSTQITPSLVRYQILRRRYPRVFTRRASGPILGKSPTSSMREFGRLRYTRITPTWYKYYPEWRMIDFAFRPSRRADSSSALKVRAGHFVNCQYYEFDGRKDSLRDSLSHIFSIATQKIIFVSGKTIALNKSITQA